LTRQSVRIELRGAFPAKQRVLASARLAEEFRGFAVLLDGFFRMVLLLLQEGVTRNAFRRLRRGGMAQKTIVDGQRLGFVLGLDQQVKQVAIVNGRAVWLFHARIEIAQRL